jgi:2-polyprenyl-3-methyl-5-hydroxy-6-metoxy-1,4-benzoquinol methylase
MDSYSVRIYAVDFLPRALLLSANSPHAQPCRALLELTTPPPSPPMQSFALAIVAAEYVTGLIPKGTHNWRQFLTPAEVEEMIREAACSPMKLVLREGILFNPMCNDSRLDSANLSVNYILTMRKEMG